MRYLRVLKSLLWIGLFLVGLAGLLLPISYFYTASGLPPLDSEYSLEKQLRDYIEGERRAVSAGVISANQKAIPWPRPDFNGYPRDLVALYISQNNCPAFFQTPRERPLKMAWRALDAAMFQKAPPGPNGWCEFHFALHLAQELRIKPGPKRDIAAFKIHSFLQKDQLVAFDLASQRYAEGLIGVGALSRTLLHRKLSDLTLAGEAELILAMPPIGFLNQVHSCKEPVLLRRYRNAVIDRLLRDQLVTPERAARAKKQPLLCVAASQ